MDNSTQLKVSVNVEDFWDVRASFMEALDDAEIVTFIQELCQYIIIPGTIAKIREIVNDSGFDD